LIGMGIYDERPWLSIYDAGQPSDIVPEYDNGLEMFRAAVSRAADRPALHYFGATLTWSDVDRLSDGLACGLTDLGVGPGDRVAVYLQNVPQLMLAMVAAWKAGGIMVSLNSMYRHREVETVLRDSGAKAMIVLESLYTAIAAEVVPATDVEVVITTSELDFLDEVPPSLAGGLRGHPDGTHDLLELARRHEGHRPADVTLDGEDVALLTYTSGTTGPPKGAMNTHRNVVFSAQGVREWFHLGEEDVMLGIAPLFHITGLIAHVAVSMVASMPLVLFYRFDAEVVLELIERWRPTATIGSITAFMALMNHPSLDERAVSHLTKVYSGGQAIAPAVVEAFETQVGAYIHNVYGLTETSVTHAVPLHARAPVDPQSGALSIGVPTFNTVARILDVEGNELPPGDVGELEIRGPQVTPGYWGHPEETAHALPGGALRTGDVGFMDAQGWFYIVDRMKDMIVASGFKVWPREVEDVLYSHPAVREAAVVGVPDTYRGETVKAFVSFKRDQSADEQELIAFCRERMAAYKYPRSVVILDELPKTATGKFLRRQLREPPAGETLPG
jgi:long-chain acyl-CoA synthetase